MDITGSPLPYSFPILKNAEILQCLSEAGIDLSQTELLEPNRHKEKVKSVFASLLHLALNLDDDYFQTFSTTALEKRKALSDPDLHKDSFGDLKFLMACRKLMKICGMYNYHQPTTGSGSGSSSNNGSSSNTTPIAIPNHINANTASFTWNDLHAPTAKRFRRQLSAAINYIKFREDRLQVYAELLSGRDELLAGLQEVQAETATLSQQLHQAKAQADGRWEEAKEMENDCNELEGEIGQQNKVQATLRQECNVLKKRGNELKDQVATAQLALQEMEDEERKVLPHVVKDPESILRKTEDLNQRLRETLERGEEAKQEAKRTKQCVVNTQDAISNVELSIRLMDEVKDEQENYDKLLQESNGYQNQASEHLQEYNALKEEEELKKMELDQLKEQIKTNKKHIKNQMDAAQINLTNANQELLTVEKEQREGMARVEAGEEEIRILQNIIEEERKKTDREIEEMMEKYRSIERIIREKDGQLLEALSA